jgi:hypothetical protein
LSGLFGYAGDWPEERSPEIHPCVKISPKLFRLRFQNH